VRRGCCDGMFRRSVRRDVGRGLPGTAAARATRPRARGQVETLDPDERCSADASCRRPPSATLKGSKPGTATHAGAAPGPAPPPLPELDLEHPLSYWMLGLHARQVRQSIAHGRLAATIERCGQGGPAPVVWTSHLSHGQRRRQLVPLERWRSGRNCSRTRCRAASPSRLAQSGSRSRSATAPPNRQLSLAGEGLDEARPS
jgi:hypothetical protein